MPTRELSSPPAQPVWWRVVSYSMAPWALDANSLKPKHVRVFAKTWFEARALAMREIPGAESVEIQQESR